MRLSRSRRWLTRLALAIGAATMLSDGLRLVCTNLAGKSPPSGRAIRRRTRTWGEEHVPTHARIETRIAARMGMRGRRLRDCLCRRAVTGQDRVDILSWPLRTKSSGRAS